MANKRILKKQIHYICGDLAAECIMAREIVPGIDAQKMNEVICRIAALQEQTLAKISFAFDKTPAEFESGKLYNKAREEYNAKAFRTLTAEFNNAVKEIVHEMNQALPESQKQINKQIANS